jgi:23S rRNA pseudouridine2604 synthase
MSDPIRLSKRLIELTGCTRREAELYIEGGWVRVNGFVIEHPQHPVSDEQVVLDPEADLTSVGPATLLVNCPPKQTLEQLLPALDHSHHWPEDSSGIRQLKRHFRHLEECFPLQSESDVSGLCVLTQNRIMLRKWEERQGTLEQEYVVDIEGELTDALISQLNRRASGQGKKQSVKISRQSEARLRFAMKNPAPGQIAEICNSAGLGIVAMRRLRIGAVSLRKMPPGQWRYLPEGERF